MNVNKLNANLKTFWLDNSAPFYILSIIIHSSRMLEHIECKCQIVKNFTPSWFASVMGTGILAITSMLYSSHFAILKDIAIILFYFNVALFFILLIPWILRWIYFKQDAIRDIEHPILSNFYATIAIAMLILAADFIVIGKCMLLGEIFWVIGTIFTIFFSLLTPYIVFKGEHVEIHHINPAWFIPPVGLIVIPIAGSHILSSLSGISYQLVMMLNYFGFGAGFFLYISLMTICMYRFILHTPLPSTLAPTIWINLGPIGAGSVALINLVKYSPFVHVKEPFFVFTFFLWGFGIWWVLMAIALTIYYIKKIDLPYAMSWWAFTFPLGAYVAASHSVAVLFGNEVVDSIGFMLYLLLFLLWAITLLKTGMNAYNGRLFKE